MKTRELVLQSVIKYMEINQYSPSIRDICRMTGLKSTSTVYGHLNSLASEGRIKFDGVRCIAVKGYKFGKI